MKPLEPASPEDVALAAMERLQKLGIDSELDREHKVAKGHLKLSGEVVANLWDGTPVERIGFVNEGVDEIRLSEPGYLSDAPPLPLEGIASAKDLATSAARAHDAWVARLTDLDVELARLKLGHRLHSSRGLYVVNRPCGRHKVEFGVRADGVIEILSVDGASVASVAADVRTFPFVKQISVAELEAMVEEHADRALSGSKNGSRPTELLVRFRDRGHVKANLDEAISRGGLFVQWEGSLAVGAPVHLRIELPGSARAVEADGEVVLVVGKEDAAKKKRPPGVGIKLTGRAAEARKEIEDFLARS